MSTNRNKYNFVTICFWLSFLIATKMAMAVAQAAAAPEAQQEDMHQQQHQQQQQQQFSVISSKIDENTNQLEAESINPNTMHAFSPRLDYSNEWRPVGRGDPLKKDPTFDYSPPTLEHVRYWAESKDGKPENGNSERNPASPNKGDIMLLGMPNPANIRGAAQSSAAIGALKNAKGETPLLQPKYTSVRRSYYAQQLPTRLMPPPMQAMPPAAASFNMLMKPSAQTEYRHNMPTSHMPSTGMSSMSSMSTHPKPHYASMSTPSWMYSSGSTMQSQLQHHQNHPGAPSRTANSYDSNPHETVHYFSYTRPSSPSSFTSTMHHVEPQSYSPNSIHHSHSALKPTGSQRKPWLHELLQKEVVKPTKLPHIATSHYTLADTTKPIYERMPGASLVGISTTYAPVAYVSSTTTRSPQPTMIAITSSPSYQHMITTNAPMSTTTVAPTSPSTTTTRAVYTTAAATTTHAPTTTTSSRLLIPTTSNLAYRPTVAPMQMTTDSLFSHYKQPEKPLMGPMYLIIEGHSKVKKYGKNEINLHLPKIVPVIPKREPVVRIADPQEQRGTPETFQVTHLHTKTSTTTTTPMPRTTRKPVATTTAAPTKTTTTTTTTTARTTTTEKNTLKDSALTDVGIAPPTGMQGLFSLLDASLGSIFADEPASADAPAPIIEQTATATQMPNSILANTPATKLKPVPMALHGSIKSQAPAVAIDARVGTKAQTIVAADTDNDTNETSADDDYTGSEVTFTTEPAPREVRQVFDYDQLPESRLKDFAIESFSDDGESVLYEDDEEDDGVVAATASDEYQDDNQQLIKRIDRLVDDDTDLDYEEELEDLELEDVRRIDNYNTATAQRQTTQN